MQWAAADKSPRSHWLRCERLGIATRIRQHWCKTDTHNGNDPRNPLQMGSSVNMNEDRRARGERRTVIARRDEAPLVQHPDVEIVSDVNSAPSRLRPIEPQHNAFPSAVDKSRTLRSALRFDLALPRFAFLQENLPRLKVSLLLASFIGCVLVPAFAATVYFAIFASDQFAAQARFAVRQIDIGSTDTTATADNSSTGSTDVNFSFTAPGQNAYIVTSYINSRAIVDDLNKTLNLREIFGDPEPISGHA